MLRSEEAYSGPDEGPFQTLVKHDMTDRQFSNPLKGTVSPLVKTVPGYACRPQRLEAKSNLEMLYRLAIRQIWKIDCRLPRSIWNMIWLHHECRMLEWNGHLSSVTSLFFNEPPLSCDLPARSPSCITAKHLLFETQTSGAPLPPKSNQRARLRYQIKRHAAPLCSAADQCSPLSNPYFIWALKPIS